MNLQQTNQVCDLSCAAAEERWIACGVAVAGGAAACVPSVKCLVAGDSAALKLRREECFVARGDAVVSVARVVCFACVSAGHSSLAIRARVAVLQSPLTSILHPVGYVVSVRRRDTDTNRYKVNTQALCAYTCMFVCLCTRAWSRPVQIDTFYVTCVTSYRELESSRI